MLRDWLCGVSSIVGGGCVLKKEVVTATSAVVVVVLQFLSPNLFSFCIGLQAARPRQP
jgi:hypothetical protein